MLNLMSLSLQAMPVSDKQLHLNGKASSVHNSTASCLVCASQYQDAAAVTLTNVLPK